MIFGKNVISTNCFNKFYPLWIVSHVQQLETVENHTLITHVFIVVIVKKSKKKMKMKKKKHEVNPIYY